MLQKKPSNNNNNNNEYLEITAHKKREKTAKRQQIINELRLVPKKDEYF